MCDAGALELVGKLLHDIEVQAELSIVYSDIGAVQKGISTLSSRFPGVDSDTVKTICEAIDKAERYASEQTGCMAEAVCYETDLVRKRLAGQVGRPLAGTP